MIEKCIKCGVRPRLPKRRVCNKCKYKAQKKRVKKRPIKKIEKVEKYSPIMKGFYVNTPHKIDRKMARDCFGGYY